MDTGASHHITSNTHNMHAYSEYTETDDVIVGDGNGVKITHTCLTTLPTPSRNFVLKVVLCAPTIYRNLIFVRLFCVQNKTSIGFSLLFLL